MNSVFRQSFGTALCLGFVFMVAGNPAAAESTKTLSTGLKKLERRVTKLEVTLSSALRGKKGHKVLRAADDQQSSTWDGTIYTPAATGVDEQSFTVTFTPTSDSTGTWSSTPYNLVAPATAFFDPPQQGTFSGDYRIIQNSMFFFNVVSTAEVNTGTMGSVVVDVKDNGMLLSSFSTSLPSPLVSLTPQR